MYQVAQRIRMTKAVEIPVMKLGKSRLNCTADVLTVGGGYTDSYERVFHVRPGVLGLFAILKRMFRFSDARLPLTLDSDLCRQFTSGLTPGPAGINPKLNMGVFAPPVPLATVVSPQPSTGCVAYSCF